MLATITIKNFQAHKRLHIKLDPRITTIVGPSDVGKSAIIRALQWLVFNRPAGDAFMRTGAKDVAVEVTIPEDGGAVTVARSKGAENTYTLQDEVYRAFGNDVPADITALLNLGPINFQQQHDSPFWFSATAGEVSRQLNEIIDLSIIDSTLANLASGLRKARTMVEVVEQRAADAVAERGRLKPARQMNDDLSAVEAAEKAFEDHRKISETLADRIKVARTYHQARKNATDANVAANFAYQAGESWRECHAQRQKLAELVVKGTNDAKIAAQKIPELHSIDALAKRAGAAGAIVTRLAGLVHTANEQEEERCENQKELSSGKALLKKLMGKACPLCGHAIRS